MDSWWTGSVIVQWLRRVIEGVHRSVNSWMHASLTAEMVKQFAATFARRPLQSVGLMLTSAVGTRLIVGMMIGLPDTVPTRAAGLILGCVGWLGASGVLDVAKKRSVIVGWLSRWWRATTG